MPEIGDTGKVWIRGTMRPVFAVRVDDRFFVPGREDGQSIAYWIDEGFLCIDLHDAENKARTGKRFSLDAEATAAATLFSGFTRTRHADVMVTTEEAGETFTLKGMDYDAANAAAMDRRAFWRLAMASWT
ncbi:MAG: hypothetical protein ACE5G9_07855 [Nitrospinales bacterium]